MWAGGDSVVAGRGPNRFPLPSPAAGGKMEEGVCATSICYPLPSPGAGSTACCGPEWAGARPATRQWGTGTTPATETVGLSPNTQLRGRCH